MYAQREYFCDCARFCETRRKVSKRTYFAHAPHRRNQLQNALNDYLFQHEADPGLRQTDPDELEVMPDDDEPNDGDDEREYRDLDAPDHMPVQHDMDDDLDDLYADYVPNAREDLEFEVAVGDDDGEVTDEEISVDEDVSRSSSETLSFDAHFMPG